MPVDMQRWKEWDELEVRQEKMTKDGVKVILEKKKSNPHITVRLEGMRDIPPWHEYGLHKTKFLLFADSGGWEDKTNQEVVDEAMRVFDGVDESKVRALQNAFDEENAARNRVYMASRAFKIPKETKYI